MVLLREFPMVDDSTILPCAECGLTPSGVETLRPAGRQVDVYRVRCICGLGGNIVWSVSPAAAVRLWNRHMAKQPQDGPQDQVYLEARSYESRAGFRIARNR